MGRNLHATPIGQLGGLSGGSKVIFKLGFDAQTFFNVGRYFQIGTFSVFQKTVSNLCYFAPKIYKGKFSKYKGNFD